MKKSVVSLLLVLVCGWISNTAYAVTNDPVANIEKKILTELEKSSDESTTFENVDIDLKESELTINAIKQIDDDIEKIEIKQEFQEEVISSDGLQITESTEEGTKEFSIYFGTLEQKNELDKAIAEEKIIMSDIESGKYSEEEIQKIELPTKKIFENEKNHITTEEQLAETPIVVTDEQTQEKKEIAPEDGIASGFAIGPGIRIAVPVARQLIKIFFAAIVGGLLGLALTIFSVNSNYRQFYDHYRAVRTGRVGIVVYSGMNLNTAVTFMKLNGDLWSTSSTDAFKVARLAGGLRGGKFQQPILEKKIKPGNFPHYHTWNRKGGHSFFGVAARG
ncbi:hypothetical protein JZO66_10885 [Enterococcus sp. DIV0242_7C1]|uniref:DUF5683 domain-containing protein n=1 Tax=Candidatus Enterococcus dunnyi TaxID=1834192 RepID=A0A200JE00_9ENTE|nr:MULTISPECIES: hypothetical protein [unclassified Enterococcus]MBO0471050.1 hypothetical protein [Enterococcus sp. DIV0242_7C1]OUZ34787.1 hypothetical protein A5889_000262 [Enterococcus sp. 9D6_DIV0238]